MKTKTKTFNYITLLGIASGTLFLPFPWVLTFMYGGLLAHTNGQEYLLETVVALLWGLCGFFNMVALLLGLALYETIKTPSKRTQVWANICEHLGHPYTVFPPLETLHQWITEWGHQLTPSVDIQLINTHIDEFISTIIDMPYVLHLCEHLGLAYHKVTHTLVSEEPKPVKSPPVAPPTGDPQVDSLMEAITHLHKLEKEPVDIKSLIEMERIINTLEQAQKG